VTDVNTGSVISGASVTWGSSYSTTTNSSGIYSFNSVPCETHTLTVSKSGYQTYSQSYTPTCNASSLKNVALTPGLTLCPIESPAFGVTIITHGYGFWSNKTNTNGWVSKMADAIAQQAGGKDEVAQYTMRICGNIVDGFPPYIESFELDPGSKDISQMCSAAIIIKVDWSDLDSGACTDFDWTMTSTKVIGDLVWQGLHYVNLPGNNPYVELPIHLIGHSRGASVMSQVASVLAAEGIWVDQLTTLDPHPVCVDQMVKTWENIRFADNYWQSRGFPDGSSIYGSHDVSLTDIVDNHSLIHTYYHGTIDQQAKNDGDDGQIIPDWYDEIMTPKRTARDKSGFKFSRVGGGDWWSSVLNDGLAWDMNDPPSSVNRTFVSREGVIQWPNILLRNINSQWIIQVSQSLPIQYYYEDYDSDVMITFFKDNDQNPYNNSSSQDIKTINQSGYIRNAQVSSFFWTPTATDAGQSYFIGAKIEDVNTPRRHTRYYYLHKTITVNPESTIPDLTVLSITAPIQAATGESISVTFTVKNLGSGASGGFGNRISLGTSAYGTQISLADFSMVSLAPNESRTETRYVSIPASISPGNYWITVFADGPAPGSVNESNENNNIGSTTPNQINILAPLYSITASAGSGGSISPSGTFTKVAGTSQTFIATPSNDYTVDKWSLDGNEVQLNGNSYTLSNIQANHTVSVTFKSAIKYILNVSAVNGTVTKNPDQTSYVAGTVVTLTATPANGYQFSGWTGDAGGGTNPLTIKMDNSKNITANFTTLSQGTGSIRVSIVPQEAANDGAQWKLTTESIWHNSGSAKYEILFGTYQVEFKAISGWITPSNKEVTIFAGQPDIWIDSDPYVQTIVTNRTLTVASTNPSSGVSITASPNDNNGQGSGTTPFTRTYNINTTVTLTAPSTAGGNNFQKWLRNGVDLTTSQTANVTMDADYTMTAVYVSLPTVTSFQIDNGAAETTSHTVTLNNTATGIPTHYMASESASFTGATWQTYAAAPPFTLSPGDGAKTVHFKVGNANGE